MRIFIMGLWAMVLVVGTISCGSDDNKATNPIDSDSRGDTVTNGDTTSDTNSDSSVFVDQCKDNDDCNDGAFCNGEETCVPKQANAAPNGCVQGAAPCEAANCDETTNQCSCVVPDADNDGARSVVCGGNDCDDNDARRYPSNTEVCDEQGHDEDCDLSTIAGPSDGDKDLDNFISVKCCNQINENNAQLQCGNDCDDSLAGVNPGAVESCNMIDDNCDGILDGLEQSGDLRITWYLDKDGDGYGTTESSMMACSAPGSSYTLNKGDCNDDPLDSTVNAASVHPGAEEICDGVINHNCNEVKDDGCTCADKDTDECGPFYPQEAGDTEPPVMIPAAMIGVGICKKGHITCINGIWPSNCVDDVGPMENEVCDVTGLDEDCDGQVNEVGANGTEPWYLDVDGDDHGNPATEVIACYQPPPLGDAEYVEQAGDCDDNDPARFEGNDESCDNIDNDCNYLVDETPDDTDSDTDPQAYGQHHICYDDADDDNFAAAGATTVHHCNACGDNETARVPLDVTSIDCNEGVKGINPDAVEECDYIDNDCDLLVDEYDTDTVNPSSGQLHRTYYRDTDADGFGDANVDTSACEVPDNFVANANDCNDFDAYILSITGCAPDPAANTTYTCQSSDCVITQCPENLADCDNDYLSDCETNLTTDINNCSECGKICQLTCGEVDDQIDCDEIVEISAGERHSCAIRDSGKVACWGYNADGELGTGDTTPSNVPRETIVLTSATKISAGYTHTCAIDSAATGSNVFCWGNNENFQIGKPDNTLDFTEPTQVGLSDLRGALDICSGGGHSCAVLSDNTVACWGAGGQGQLGTGFTTSTYQRNKVLVDGDYLTDVESVSCGMIHTCALKTDGSVVCWGFDSSGQLGDGIAPLTECSGDCSATAVAVSVADVDYVIAGRIQTCAVTSSGVVKCWGNIEYWYGSNTESPVDIVSLDGALGVDMGYEHICSISTIGSLRCLGDNANGQLGSEDTLETDVVHLPSSASGIAANAYFTCALWGIDPAKCWGENADGQLGIETNNETPIPTEIGALSD